MTKWLTAKETLYLGGFQIGAKGPWYWWSGDETGDEKGPSKVMVTFWHPGQPNAASPECMVAGYSNGKYPLWYDIGCTSKYKALCELRCSAMRN